MQVNHLVSNQAREVFYSLIMKLFQCYEFKRCLTISFSANYESIMLNQNRHLDNNHISSISVQVLTSAEMSMLILANKDLLDNYLRVMRTFVQRLAEKPKSEDTYIACFSIIHDLKYLARPEVL